MPSEQCTSYHVCDDILEEISSYLPLGDKKSLSILRHSSRDILQPSLFRLVHFDIPAEKSITAEIITKLESEVNFFSTPRIAAAIRACQITVFDGYDEPHSVISPSSQAGHMLDKIIDLLASFHRLEQITLLGVSLLPRHWDVLKGIEGLQQILCSHCTYESGDVSPGVLSSLRLFSMNPHHASTDPPVPTSFDWIPHIPETIQSLELTNQVPALVQYFTNNGTLYSYLTSLHYTITQDEFEGYTPFLLSLFDNFPSLQELTLDSSAVYLPKLESAVIEADSHLSKLGIYKGPADLLGKLAADGSPIRHVLPRYPEYTSIQMVIDAFSCDQLLQIESLQLKIFHILNLVPVVENFKGLQALSISMDYYDVPSYSTCRDLLASIREKVVQSKTPVKYLWLHITTPQSKPYRGEQRLQRDAFLSFCMDVFSKLEYVVVTGDKNWRRRFTTGEFEVTGDEIHFDDWRRARQGHLNWNYRKSICFDTF